MKLGRLTPAGMQRFSDFLDQLHTDGSVPLPEQILSLPGYFEVIDEETEVIPHKFKSRWEAARYLNSLLSVPGLVDPEHDVELWAALSAFYFDLLCPKDKAGNRKIHQRARYIPEPRNYKRYYRHLLLGPYLIYRAHADQPERTMALLCGPLHFRPDVEEQIAANSELISNSAVVELATRLYYDLTTKATKPGAGGKEQGSPRRLVAILNQFGLTWDLYAATTNELLHLLPKEFNRFIAK